MSHFPTVHISCPCAASISIAPKTPGKSGRKVQQEEDEIEEEEETFDPGSTRSNFSLFPLENLLYCEDCNQIRCPRCVHDEIVCYFCPSCLFEVPSSTVKTEGNRCTRNCFSCPICFASLVVAATREDQGGPYILLCPHCQWSSSEIGIEFEKPTSITTQLAQKLKPPATAPVSMSPSSDSYFPTINIPIINTPTISLPPSDVARVPTTPEMYQRLKVHYASQRASTGTDEFGTSPGALSRLMGLYSSSLTVTGATSRNRGFAGITKSTAKDRRADWSEMENTLEVQSEEDTISKLRKAGFHGTTTPAQRTIQPTNPLFTSDVRPLGALLRTKRSKRCRACRHILVKPESKVTTTRFRIRLVALNYIPSLSISRLDPTSVSYTSLSPLTTHQFLLTVTNPLFDIINVTLATPQRTPGRYGTTVTILCPDFEVGANSDMWDEALGGETTPGAVGKGRKGKKTGNTGTVWDAGRNWTTVVIEIVPPLLPSEYSADSPEGAENDKPTESDYLVQIPVSVRVEYETDLEREDGLGKEVKEKREHTYWSVLGLGRIGKLGSGGSGGDVMGVSGPSAGGMLMGRATSFSTSKVGGAPPIVAGMVGMGVAGGLGKRNIK